MDPKANIAEQLRHANAIMDDSSDEIDSFHAVSLAELVLALDEWRKKGGFDPYQ